MKRAVASLYLASGSFALLGILLRIPWLVREPRAEASLQEIDAIRVLLEACARLGIDDPLAGLPAIARRQFLVYDPGGLLEFTAVASITSLVLYAVLATVALPPALLVARFAGSRLYAAALVGGFAAPAAWVLGAEVAPALPGAGAVLASWGLAALLALVAFAATRDAVSLVRGLSILCGSLLLVASAAALASLVVAPPFVRGIATGPSCPRIAREGPVPPSIVLIVADTLRADYLGSYGFQGDVSPNLDRLARDSVRFANAVSQAPWTKPSIASLFTSSYPEQHRVTDHHGQIAGGDASSATRTDTLSPEASTLAEALCAAGYDTAAFVANGWLRAAYGFAQGFEDYVDHYGYTPARVMLGDVEQWLEARNGDAPYFLYLHFMDPHGPYDAPERDHAALLASPSLVEPGPPAGGACASIPDWISKGSGLDASHAADPLAWRAQYAAGVRSFDRQLGALLRRFGSGAPLGDTLLVFTSDHGEELCEHGGWNHGHNLFDYQTSVPLLVRLPGGRQGGRTVDAVVSLVDLMPTILSAAGASHDTALVGHDLAPLLRGASEPDETRVAFATSSKDDPGLVSMRGRRYKLLYDRTRQQARLFDLLADPHERTNIAAEEERVLSEMRALLRQHLEALVGGIEPPAATLSREDVEQLRDLGYLE